MNTMIKVKKETHAQFKQLAKDKGMMFDAFLKLVLEDYERNEQIKRLKQQGAI